MFGKNIRKFNLDFHHQTSKIDAQDGWKWLICENLHSREKKKW